MNWILNLDIWIRLVVLFGAGVLAGNVVNLAIDRLGLQPRGRSPWSPYHPRDGGNIWLDRLPLVGAVRLRRKTQDVALWLRPLILELLTGALVAGLYWWEIHEVGILMRPYDPTRGPVAPSSVTFSILHVVYASHVLLVLLMLAASFIDMDDRVIPDSITVTGTLAALVLSGTYAWNLMPAELRLVTPGVQFVEWTSLVYPNRLLHQWPPLLDPYPQPLSLAAALGLFWGWCLALLPRLWLPRRGLERASRLLVAHAMRAPNLPLVASVALGGTIFIVAIWWTGMPTWAGLLTSLAGLAMSGAVVWGVRIAGTWALKREAMGFGDVTLMAMIGSFLGWQAGVAIFFFAPFAGLVVGLLGLVLRRQHEIPYGPFLCLATLGVIVAWLPLWERLRPLFELGWMVPLILVGCLALLAVMLVAWRSILGMTSKPPQP